MDRFADGDERPELAALLVEQFAVLDDARPVGARALETDDAVVLTFTWPAPPVDEMLIAEGRTEELEAFRRGVLELACPALADAVGVELGRVVVAASASIGADPRQAIFRFELGERTATSRTSIEGTRNWAAHLRRNARRQTAEYRERREELAGRREELRRLVAELDR